MIIMTTATFIALGASAIGLVVFAFCIYVAVSASKKKATSQLSQHEDPGA
jgi:hypothetical protein